MKSDTVIAIIAIVIGVLSMILNTHMMIAH